jgi:hypothetical protein
MLKLTVTEKSGASIQYQSPVELDYSALGHGKAERLVPESEEHDPADVLETVQVEVSPAIPAVLDGEGNVLEPEVPAVVVPHVRLRAEYTVEVQDITAEHELAQVIASRKAEYPSAEEFLNAFFDGGQAALDALQAQRLAVKAKYPKPGV